MPKAIIRFLKLTSLNEETISYFSKLALSLIEERKNNKDEIYNDFIELLLKSESEGEVEKNYEKDGHIVKKLSTEEIVGRFEKLIKICLNSILIIHSFSVIGQCFIFFVAGLETVGFVLEKVHKNPILIVYFL